MFLLKLFRLMVPSSSSKQWHLFYVYDTLAENVFDTSHIDFAHHKVNVWIWEYWLMIKLLLFYLTTFGILNWRILTEIAWDIESSLVPSV